MRSSIAFLRNKVVEFAMERSRRGYARSRGDLSQDLSFTEATRRFPDRNDLHAYMHRFFYESLPETLRLHREYFSKEGRGFGEPAFHSMWYLLLREFRPTNLLEIGVYRGQVVSLWTLIGRELSIPVGVRCISPFSSAGDQVSRYRQLDYLEDVMRNFDHFQLPRPNYLKGFSTDPQAIAYLRAEPLDFVYIDGGHDYDVVLSDYRNSVDALKPGGILVMDDASLGTNFAPPKFSFAGHPGPSKVAREIADKELQFLGGVGHQNVYRKP